MKKVRNFFGEDHQLRTHKVMLKYGDDLRQDQLVLQLMGLMDRLLKNVNLDLKLTLFRVLATEATSGMMEFVSNSYTMTDVMKEHKGDIRAFFRHHNRPPAAGEQGGGDGNGGNGGNGEEDWEDGVRPEVLDTFIKSCAGYSVISYILGFGDRHLENIMLKPTGHLWHLDFGFIFGMEPKMWASQIRLTKEMVTAMGVSGDGHGLEKFRRYACQAYTILRCVEV